jgi:hypothetical protein
MKRSLRTLFLKEKKKRGALSREQFIRRDPARRTFVNAISFYARVLEAAVAVARLEEAVARLEAEVTVEEVHGSPPDLNDWGGAC